MFFLWILVFVFGLRKTSWVRNLWDRKGHYFPITLEGVSWPPYQTSMFPHVVALHRGMMSPLWLRLLHQTGQNFLIFFHNPPWERKGWGSIKSRTLYWEFSFDVLCEPFFLTKYNIPAMLFGMAILLLPTFTLQSQQPVLFNPKPWWLFSFSCNIPTVPFLVSQV